MLQSWYLLIEEEPREAAVNMAVDQHLLELVDREVLAAPVLRVYAWARPTLSLGYHQQWRRTVRMEALQEYGIDLVRRWTGGRAVLHDHGEITYSVIAPIVPPFVPRVRHNYRLIGEALERFTDLGMSKGNLEQEDRDSASARSMKHTPCFASLSPSEIETRGKKLIGSAQKLGKKGFLQHGSIPLIHRPEVLEAVTGTKLDMSRFMVSLEEHYRNAGLPMPARDELVKSLVQAFEMRFGIRFRDIGEGGYSKGKEVAEIADNQFQRDHWTFRK